jgi:monoamine oxidase
MAEKPDVDVAIIGGGISGIYTGWRLLTSDLGGSPLGSWAAARGGRLSVSIFEGSDRIGGRLLSARSPHMPDTTAEIGGMRYVTAQTLVTHLVEQVLKLPFHSQAVFEKENIAFVRGRLLRQGNLGDPTVLPYFLDPSEAAWLAARQNGQESPAGLIGRVLTDLMPGINAHLSDGTLRQYLETVVIDGEPLWKHGFWNLLARGMSMDGHQAARTLVGYDCLGGNYNALDLTAEFFDFTPGVQYRMVDAGYETVPWLLQQRFNDAGGQLHLEQWLDGFTGVTLDDGSQGVRLTLRGGSTLTARAIVLAMPKRSIELLLPEGEVLGAANTDFRYNLASVSAVPLFKLFLVYKECWWQDAGVTSGRSLTDLPLHQCFYWPSGAKGTTVPGRTDPGMLMAYDDQESVGFWAGLDNRGHAHKAGMPLAVRHSGEGRQLFDREPAALMAGLVDPFEARLKDNWNRHTATRQMVSEMHRQLMAMHGVDSAPQPIDAAYMDWSRDPFGGGVHFWNTNYNSAEVLDYMVQPVTDFPCFICGEAYSTNQTWVEGALQTAESVLKRLGVAPGGLS